MAFTHDVVARTVILFVNKKIFQISIISPYKPTTDFDILN